MGKETGRTEHGLLGRIRDHWPWVAPATYVYVTIVGVVDSLLRFNAFGFNVLEFAEINDFVLVALRDPRAFLVVAAFIAYGSIGIVLSWLSEARRRQLRERGGNGQSRTLFEMPRIRNFYRLIFIAVLFISPYFGPLIYNKGYGDEWKMNLLEDPSRKVSLTIKVVGATSLEVMNDLSLIGTTSKYLFLVDEDDTMTLVPHDNVQTITREL